ncbi:hypothetical protein ACFVHB_11885 [Kitasatospora sp. NPDC127111]|uniref:hypothetical protein n=1 Tax=Kitasatospora sp. NPDC127111 TaxID=3345363 RepID=UPI00363FF3F6
MLTTTVHTRNHRHTLRRFHASGLLSLLGVVAAAPVTALVQPVVTALTLIAVLGQSWSSTGSGLVLPAIAAQAGSAALWIVITYAAARRARLASPWHAVFVPLYSLLWSIAAWRSVHQLAVAPFAWEKTPHGTHEAAGTAERALRSP